MNLKSLSCGEDEKAEITEASFFVFHFNRTSGSPPRPRARRDVEDAQKSAKSRGPRGERKRRRKRKGEKKGERKGGSGEEAQKRVRKDLKNRNFFGQIPRKKQFFARPSLAEKASHF